MTDEQLMEVWRRASSNLDQARLSLTNPQDEALGLFDEFCDHNELGLALDRLADVANAQQAPRVVWEKLRAAAAAMGLDKDNPTYGAAIRLIKEHLTRAGNWAELRSLLNEWDPIGVYDVKANPDEYGCLEAPLMSLLAEGAGVAAVARFLEHELRGHFGLDPQLHRPEEFAAHLVDWFRAGQQRVGGNS